MNPHRFRWFAIAMALAVSPAGAARANDSSAELAAGGLVLTKTDAIAMQREDLTLSPAEVRVRYEMRNDTGQPVSLRVAFPMPDVPIDTPGGMTAAGDRMIWMKPPASPDFMHFRVRANGQEIAPEVEVRAVLADGRDVARDLRAIGGDALVMHPGFFPVAGDRPLPADTQRRLKDLGALKPLPEGGWELPWTTHVTFHWQQTFAPGVTVVEHSYRPIPGFRLILIEQGDKIVGSAGDDPVQAFCLSNAAQQELRALSERTRQARRKATGEDNPTLTALTLGYILKTAQNWRGPIGTFHLTVESEPANVDMFGSGSIGNVALASLCSDLPLQQTSPRRFEVTAKDYVPKNDLRVLYVTE
jgi:hypothetical protein